MKHSGLHHIGTIAAGVLAVLLFAGLIPPTPAAASQPDSQAALEKTKSLAETQHEIVLLLLKKKDFEKAAAEANKIFSMQWPENQEPLLLKELLILTDLFLNQGQAPLSLQIIGKNSSRFRKTSSQVEILKQTGYIYKSLKQDDKALEYFQKARELESRN